MLHSMAVYQICFRDNLDRKLQAQELARIMNERFVCLDEGSFFSFLLLVLTNH